MSALVQTVERCLLAIQAFIQQSQADSDFASLEAPVSNLPKDLKEDIRRQLRKTSLQLSLPPEPLGRRFRHVFIGQRSAFFRLPSLASATEQMVDAAALLRPLLQEAELEVMAPLVRLGRGLAESISYGTVTLLYVDVRALPQETWAILSGHY